MNRRLSAVPKSSSAGIAVISSFILFMIPVFSRALTISFFSESRTTTIASRKYSHVNNISKHHEKVTSYLELSGVGGGSEDTIEVGTVLRAVNT